MERYAIIIKTDGVCVLLHCYPGDCLSLEEMQNIVEGHIEAVPTALAQGWSQEPGVGLALIVNEEGKLQNLPVNQTATDLSAAYNDVIVGNAILLGTTDEDFIGLRHTNSGVACCSFTLAVERNGKPNEQTGQRTADFIDCTAWRNTAEFICKWFSKGRVAVAAGRMQTRTWKDRHDQSRKSTELQVESMYFADSRKDAAADAPLADDDLPDTWTELSGSEPLPFL